MNYSGFNKIFDNRQIRTYPFSERKSKVTAADLLDPEEALSRRWELPGQVRKALESVVAEIALCVQDQRPVMLFTGAHLIKNGLGLLLADLVKRRYVTLIAGNGATCIHDFELALMGETSENVPAALGQGLFGMAAEFGYINAAISAGNRLQLGFGESLGRMIVDEEFRDRVFGDLGMAEPFPVFSRPELSVLATCYEARLPFTAHVGIGTDVIDQHPSFDGSAKGGCSGRDFLIYTRETTRLIDGGVVLNIGSAVTGPEVLLKAVSMAANVGFTPRRLITADFDLRAMRPDDTVNEQAEGYYYRDQKSIVNRIPGAFDGAGYYIQGNQSVTFPALYQSIVKNLDRTE